jgi:hypothetical protein
MIRHRRVTLARCSIQVDPASGTQASTVLGADLFGVKFDQCELADHSREVKLSVLDRVCVFVGQFDLVQLVNKDNGNASDVLQTASTCRTPWRSDRTLDNDAIVHRCEYERNTNVTVKSFVHDPQRFSRNHRIH